MSSVIAPEAAAAGSARGPRGEAKHWIKHRSTEHVRDAESFMHNGALISRNSASSPRYRLIENSASQNRLDRISTPQYRLISENSASQNRLVQTAPSPTAVASTPTNSFDWLDAAVGAGSTLALTLLAIGAAVAVRRTRAGVAAWH